MTTFDPDANAPSGDGGGKWLSSAGVFCVVFLALRTRGKTRTNKPFVRFRGEVICGRPEGNEGKKFHERVFLNEEAWKRLGAMTKAMGLTKEDEFDLDSDNAVRAAMLGKPFKAKFKVVTGSDQNQYAELAYSEHDPNEEEAQAMDLWVQEAEASGFYDRIHDQDWDSGGDPQSGEEGPPPAGADDDIPF